MSKPTRIQHGGVGIYLNDKQADRVQTFGSSTALNTEDLKEVGNKNIVEVIDGIPTIDVTLDTNQYGSIKTAAQLANLNIDYAYCQVEPSSGFTVAVTSGAYFIDEVRYLYKGGTIATGVEPIANRAQVVTIHLTPPGAGYTGGTLHATQHAVFDYTNPATTPTRNQNITAGDIILGEVYKINGVTSVTDDYIANFNGMGNGTALPSLCEVIVDDYEYAKVDVVAPVKESGDNTDTDKYITRTMYMENAYCNRIDMAFNTDGLSTENFSLETDNKKWFLNRARAVMVQRFRCNGVATTFMVSQTPTVLANNHSMLKVRVFHHDTGLYDTLSEVSAATTNLEYSVAGKTITIGGAALSAEHTVIARYCTDYNEDTNFEMLPNPKDFHPDPAGGVKQGNVEVYIVGPTPDSFTPTGPTYWSENYYSPSYNSNLEENFTLRLESVTITAELAREALNEIGHALPYDRPLTFPIPVTIAANAKSSDLEEFARYIERRAEWDADTLNEADIAKFSKDLSLRVYVFRETDVNRDDVPFKFQPWIKRVTIDDVAITDEAFEIAVDSNATQNFNMKSDNMTITARL
jgi:hypothetical protein